MDPNLQNFAQHIVNCHAAATVEQKLAYLKTAREYVLTYSPPVDALCLNTVFNLQVFGHLILFQELLLLVETILTAMPRVELLLPVFDFIERAGFGYGDEWIIAVLQMCGRLFASILPHILNGRTTQLAASWRLCWQKMSCLGQSLGFRALTSMCVELQSAGIDFIEVLILLYTEPTTLMLAGSGRGAPTADMLLFNSRYLIDRLTDQIAADELSGKAPLRVIASLARIVARREKYFDSLVLHLLKMTEKAEFKIKNVRSRGSSSDPSFEMEMMMTLKQSLLSLMQCGISNRQRSMLILGLSQLGASDDPTAFHRDAAFEHAHQNTSWNYISDANLDDSHLRRPGADDGREVLSARGEAGEETQEVSTQEAALSVIEKAKNAFHGKLSVAEVQSVLSFLVRSSHRDCVRLIVEELNADLIANLVVYTFTNSAVLESSENKSTQIKTEIAHAKDISMDEKMPDIDRQTVGAHEGSSAISDTGPLIMSLGERQMLIEYSSTQLLKKERSTSPDMLSTGMMYLTKVIGKSSAASIPLHVLTELFARKIESKPDMVSELSVQLLFSLFAAHGSSSCNVTDIAAFLKSMESFSESQLQHPYDQAMYRILSKISLCEAEGKDKVLKNVLLEVPVLPPAIVFDFFRKMLTRDAATIMSFLITANVLMESHPLLKPILLECVLQTCINDDSDTREKGIRLVKNKLHQDDELAERIEQFATDNLSHLANLQPEPEQAKEGPRAMPGKYCTLYLALCTRKASLLQKLLEVYGTASPEGRRVIEENAKQLSEAVNFLVPELLPLIKTVSTEAEPLLLMLLSIFPDKSPPQRVIDACLEHYTESKKVHYLVPILPGLPKKRVLELVPLLTQLPLPDFAAAIEDLVGPLPFGDSTVEPGEVLVALSSFSDVRDNSEGLNAVRNALDYCIKQLPVIFDKEVLAGALNKLVQLHTLPVLFMRMVLLSISREKELGTFVLHSVLSSAVVASKIKSDTAQWQGYILLLQKTTPASFLHLLTLPTRLMTSALKDMPKNFSERFLEFVGSDACDVRAPRDALQAIKDFLADTGDQSHATFGGSQQQSGPETSSLTPGHSPDARSDEPSVMPPPPS